MKKHLFFIIALFITLPTFSQNLKVLEDKKALVLVSFGGIESVEKKLGFDEEGLNAEIKQILRSNDIKVSNDPFTNISIIFTVEGLVMDNGTVTYSSQITVMVSAGYAIFGETLDQENVSKDDEYYFNNFYIYQRGYSGFSGRSKYSSIKESLISLARQFVEEYHKEIE